MAPLRPQRGVEPAQRYETAPGHQAQCDWADFGQLWRDPKTKKFYLLVGWEGETTDPPPASLKGIQGADLGERYQAVTTTPGNKTQFFRGGAIRHQGEAFQRVRSRLQSKGTPGAKRRLRQWQLRERRFKADVNHRIAKSVVKPRFWIGLEDLTGIRERTTVRGKRNRRRRAKGAYELVQKFILRGVPVTAIGNHRPLNGRSCLLRTGINYRFREILAL